MALYTRDADAFAALSIGAVTNPLDAAVLGGSKDPWGSEFFSWITARSLFSDQTRSDFVSPGGAAAARPRSLALRSALLPRTCHLLLVLLGCGMWMQASPRRGAAVLSLLSLLRSTACLLYTSPSPRD